MKIIHLIPIFLVLTCLKAQEDPPIAIEEEFPEFPSAEEEADEGEERSEGEGGDGGGGSGGGIEGDGGNGRAPAPNIFGGGGASANFAESIAKSAIQSVQQPGRRAPTPFFARGNCKSYLMPCKCGNNWCCLFKSIRRLYYKLKFFCRQLRFMPCRWRKTILRMILNHLTSNCPPYLRNFIRQLMTNTVINPCCRG